MGWQARRFRVPHARTVSRSSLSFDVSCQELFSTWATGGTLVLASAAERAETSQLLELLLRTRAERLFIPFSILGALAESCRERGS